jgi:hypothetical protein
VLVSIVRRRNFGGAASVDNDEKFGKGAFREAASLRVCPLWLDDLIRVRRGCIHEPSLAPSSSGGRRTTTCPHRLHRLGMPADPAIMHTGSGQNARRIADWL